MDFDESFDAFASALILFGHLVVQYSFFFNFKNIFIFNRIPLRTYFVLAFLTVGTMGMSNASVGYLNYPTQVIFKCCKLIPVLLGGILIQGILLFPVSTQHFFNVHLTYITFKKRWINVQITSCVSRVKFHFFS